MTITPEEIARLRALEAKGPDLNGAEIAELTDVRLTPLLDEIERLRADLREAVALLRELDVSDNNYDAILVRRDALLAKHREEA